MPESDPSGDRYIRIKTLRAGICGGDLKVYRGWESVTYPYFLGGHEWCGEVVEVGREEPTLAYAIQALRVGGRLLLVDWTA